MTQQQTQTPAAPAQQPQIDSVDDAFAVVSHAAYAPVFMDKLAADHGIVPQTEQEYYDLLALVPFVLDQEAKAQQQKQASARQGSFISACLNEFQQAAGQPTVAPELVKQAAANLAMRPEISRAVLSLQAHAAAQAQAQATA
jgi:hypothetical protein